MEKSIDHTTQAAEGAVVGVFGDGEPLQRLRLGLSALRHRGAEEDGVVLVTEAGLSREPLGGSPGDGGDRILPSPAPRRGAGARQLGRRRPRLGLGRGPGERPAHLGRTIRPRGASGAGEGTKTSCCSSWRPPPQHPGEPLGRRLGGASRGLRRALAHPGAPARRPGSPRPAPALCGASGAGWAVGSEQPALERLGARACRELDPGELLIVDRSGVVRLSPWPKRPARPCAVELRAPRPA
jgi:hypothetical protein